jgi:hypothetical protein
MKTALTLLLVMISGIPAIAQNTADQLARVYFYRGKDRYGPKRAKALATVDGVQVCALEKWQYCQVSIPAGERN